MLASQTRRNASAASHGAYGQLLSGMRVLELDEGIAASVAGMILADQGADVIRVEHPSTAGDRAMPGYSVWNRGKRIVRPRARSEGVVRLINRLGAEADVLILGPPWSDDLHPDLLVSQDTTNDFVQPPTICRVTGLPEGWADECNVPDDIVAAICGLFRDGRIDGADTNRPIYYPLPIAGVFAGLLLAGTAVASLFARGFDGRHRVCELSLLSAMLVPAGILAVRIDGEKVSGRPAGWSPADASYQCRDGRWFTVYQGKRRLMQGFLRALGLEDEFAGIPLGVAALGQDPRAQALHDRICEVVKTRTAAEWEQVLAAEGTTGVMCRTTSDWLRSAHARQAGLAVTIGDRGSDAVQPGPVLRVAGERPRIKPARTVARPRWLSPALRVPAATPGPRGAPLEGVRVVDLTVILAGPTAGRLLAEWGADVIKVDNMQEVPQQYIWLETGRGKRSLLLDIRTREGNEIVWKLIASADVVLENFRAGVMDRLGFGYEEVHRRFPRVVYASSNTFGYGGEFSARPGYEPIAESATGMQLRYGGPGQPPLHAPSYSVVDYATGVSAAVGVVSALFRRQQTGQGLHIETSLCAGAQLLQSNYMGGSAADQIGEIAGTEALGESAFRRLYRAADDWIFLHCDPDQATRLFDVLGIDVPAASVVADTSAAGPLASEIAVALAGCDAACWLERLQPPGILAAPVFSPDRFLADERMHRLGLLKTVDVPGVGAVTTTAPAVALAPSPALAPVSAPAGAYAEEILAELGYSAEQMDSFEAAGVIARQAY